ncbi:Ig-like domain-containing protein [Caenimonas aquaedulcis]|uniref:Ig-like domain-containing protein n=1 Tax=Caenimonas aquaedulcis TaxID=2793270 RepID=A0A931H705_9BURK|nr:Ig-like domain-containing protein [Caenimonas aquaedulcis]MBG9389698.1 Ig-like domain-containing protein [Caenimonas aquaedulcis]
MTRFMKLLGGLVTAVLVTACGGGGGSPGAVSGGTGGTTGPNPATTLEVFTSASQLTSATNSSVTFTVVAKDANNLAVPNQTVTFSATSGNLNGALPAPHTGSAGEPITSVSLSPGADPSNRSITVTVTAGNVVKTVVIPVVGSGLSLTGDPSIILGGATSYTVKATDSAGHPVSGAPLAVTSALGNNVNPSSVTTDGQGAANFIYTANKSGQDVLTVTGLGTLATTTVSVSADDFKFITPAPSANVAVGSSQTVTVSFLFGGSPVANKTVTFSSTRGVVSPSAVATDASGRATTQITSTTSGPANVIAQAVSGASQSQTQATLPITFVATDPQSLVLQANPGSLPPNAAGSNANQATLQAIVRDAAGNPVPGRVVNFSAITDGSNGSISPGSGTTDANGTVVSQFTPGALTTASNGVVISASVQGTGVFGTASLTVSGQALFISIATGNEISNLDQTTYQKEFSVYVTDANGAPAANRVVNLSVFPDVYGKGTLSYSKDAGSWGYSAGSPTSCLNEDVNRNGILNAGEDFNSDGLLTPGLPVVVSPANVTTSSTGFATFRLQYGENYALWMNTTITARTNVGGTESVKTQPYFLAASAADMSSPSTPANSVSPFGVATSCSDPN